jgi:dTDP-4-amino-4,6-dideoxygalactose transaminase
VKLSLDAGINCNDKNLKAIATARKETIMIQMFAPDYHIDECLDQIRQCLERGWAGQGFKTLEFEEAWKKYTGLPYAHFVITATAGLNMSVELLKDKYGWKEQDEIISTPLTFVATNNAILRNHMKVVFADVDDTLCLEQTDVERKITDRTRAVIYVGLGGNIGNYYSIVEICRKHNLKLILDAAHMAGTKVEGIIPGKEADVVVYSFHVTKNLTTADGGMVCFQDAELDDKLRKLAWNGIDTTMSPAKYDRHYKWKQNITKVADANNGNSIMAAIGIAQMPYLDKENEKRRAVAGWYDEALQGIQEVKFVRIPDNCESARWLYQVIVDHSRDELMEYLQSKKIGCALHYLDNTEYPMYGKQNGICKNATYYSDHIVSLPCHTKITKEDVRTIASEIKLFYAGRNLADV